MILKPTGKPVRVTVRDMATGKSKSMTVYNTTPNRVLNLFREFAEQSAARDTDSTPAPSRN